MRRRDRAGITLTESVLPPGLELAKHSHANAYFCAVLRGTFTETYGYKTRDCGPSLVKFHPSDEVHAERFHCDGARLLSRSGPNGRSTLGGTHRPSTAPRPSKAGA